MDIILLTKGLGQKGALTIRRWHLVCFSLFSFFLLPSSVLFYGYQLGQDSAVSTPHALQLEWQTIQSQHQQELSEAKQQAQDNLNALAMNVGRLQAHVMRIDALGERLTDMADIDSGEFDFSVTPAQGGPENAAFTQDVTVND